MSPTRATHVALIIGSDDVEMEDPMRNWRATLVSFDLNANDQGDESMKRLTYRSDACV